MDESERKRKLKAGREKFNQYLKKKVEESKNVEVKRKGTKTGEPTCFEQHSAVHTEASVSTSSVSSEVVHIIPHMSTSSEDDSSEELEEKTDVPENDAGNTSNSAVLQSDLKDDELTSSSALDLGCYPDTGTHDSEDDVAKLNGDIIESRLKEYTIKLQEYEDALGKRDIFISQLTESLSVTIEQRDKLQVEATKQADLLAKEIETLKLQIQNATEFLKNQKGKNGISAAELLEANNQIIALNQSCSEKTNAIERLNNQNAYLNGRLNQLQTQLDGTVSRHSELEAELKARYNEIATISSVNSELLKSLNEVTEQHDNVGRLLRVKEEEVSQSEINRLAIEREFRESVENETWKLRDHESFLKSELERIRFDYASQEEAFKEREIESNSFIDNLRLELETSKRLLEDSKTGSTQEIQNLTEQIRDLQTKLSEWPIVMEQQLENNERQTEAMMNEMKMSHQLEMDNLKETILTLNLEREHLQIRMTEAESYQSNSDLIEQLQLELQGKTLTIEQYAEKVKAMELTISSSSYDVDELKIKLDQVMSEKMDIQTNLVRAEETVKQLQLQNSTLKNLEVLFNSEKENLNDCRAQLERKDEAYRDLEKQFEDTTKQLSALMQQLQLRNSTFNNLEVLFNSEKENLNDCRAQLERKDEAYRDLEKQFADTTKQLADLMQLFNKATSDKVEIEVILKSKESVLEQLGVQIQSLEGIVSDEQKLREQCKQELFNLNEAYRDMESRFDSQSKQMRDLQIVSDQISSEKLELQRKLKINEEVLEQLNQINANHRTQEDAWNNEKKMFDNYKIETETQLKTTNDVIENLRLENSQLDALKTELETKRQLLESVHKDLTYLDDKHQSLLFESEKQKQRTDELQSHLDQLIVEEQMTSSRYNDLKTEYDRLKRSSVVSCAEVQVDLDDQLNWKEKYDQLLQEKVKLETELQTNELDTGITGENIYVCGADSTDKQADKRSHIQSVAAEETESDLPEVPHAKYDGFMDKFVKIVDQLINQIEIEKDLDLRDIVNELSVLRGNMMTFVSVDVLQKELAMAVDQQEMQNINIKTVLPLGTADSDSQKKRIEELETTLEQVIREKVQAVENYSELKSEMEHVKIAQASMKEEAAMSWAEVQVDLDDQVKWKEKYDQLLQEKVELEMELQTRPTEIGETYENPYLYGPDVSLDATDGHEVKRSNSKSIAEKSEAFATSDRCESRLSELLEIVDQLLNKVEIENNWDFEFVIHELHDLRELMISMESVDALQTELEIAVDQQEMKNVHIRKFQPLGNADAVHADVQTDVDDQLRWKEKYDQLLQEKIELEIELRAIQTHTEVAHTSTNIFVTDFTDEHSDKRVDRPSVADSDTKSKNVSHEDCDSCLNGLITTVDNLIRMTETEQELDGAFVANELHVLREHIVKFVSIGVLRKELENAVDQQEMELIKIKTVQPLGTEDVGILVKRIEELEKSLEQATKEKQQVTAKYTEIKSEFERLKIEIESAKELPFVSGSEIQTCLDDQVNWKEKYDQLLQEKVELEIGLQTTQLITGISQLDNTDFDANSTDGRGVERLNSHQKPEEAEQLAANAECHSRLDNSLEIVNQLLDKVENEKSLDINCVVHNLQDLRHHLLSIGSVENLQNELANAIDQQEARSIQIKTYPPLGSSEDTAILLEQIEELKTSLQQAINEKHQADANCYELKLEVERIKANIKEKLVVSCAEVQVDLDDQVKWKEKYDQLLQEKVEIEIELRTSKIDTGITSERAYLCGADIEGNLGSDVYAGELEKEMKPSVSNNDNDITTVSVRCESRLDEFLVVVDQLLKKLDSNTDLDFLSVVRDLRALREQLVSAFSVDALQQELENAVSLQEMKDIHIKHVEPLGSSETDGLTNRIKELETSLEKAIREKLEISAKYDELQTEFGQLKSIHGHRPVSCAEVQVDLDDQVNWKERYNQLLQEKSELELELQTTESDTGITRQSAYVCGSDFEHEVKQSSTQSGLSSIEFTHVSYESRVHKILKTVDQLLNRVQNEKDLNLHVVVRDLSALRELLVTIISVDVLQEELENAVDQQEMKNIQIKVVQPLGSVVTADSLPHSDDLIICECNEVVGRVNDISECKVDEVFSNQSQVGNGDELLKLKQKIGDLEHQLGEKENDLVRIRQELQAKYEEDVEHVRNCLETSLALEVQADVEAEVDELKEKVDADIRARNMENVRLCIALQELKVQVQQLQRDKQKLEQSLGGGEIVSLDDVQMDFDDVQNLLALGASSKSDKWDVMSDNSDDSKMSSGHVRRLLSYLLGVYVNIGKTVNKELIHLIGTDLGVCDVTMAGDKSIQLPDWMSAEDVGETEASFISSIGEDGASDNLYENLVLEAGSKLNVAVQRLLGMLSALVQQLQEPHRSSSATNDESQILLDERNEDLVAQLTAEARSKDFLGAELNKTSDLLKATEAEKISLREELARREKQLSEMTCQLEETKAQSQKLEECLAEEGIRPPKDLISDGLGDSGQILRSIPVENQCSQLADDGTELLDENVRLHREKRGLQHRVERERSELTARIRELEQVLEETSAAQDRRLEIKSQEISDLQQQIDALEKQLRGYKHFIEEQTLEREQERDDFQRELDKLQDVSREKDRAQNSEERLSREVETWQEQLKEKNELYKQLFEKKEQLEKEVEILVEKSNSDQDVIRDLERQLDCKSRSEKMLNEQMEKLQLELTHTSRVHNDQSLEIEQLRKLSASSQLSVSTAFYEEYFGGSHLDLENPPTPESIVLELRSQVQHLEEKVGRHSLDLEGLLVVTSCLSSPCSEEVSVREQLEVLREREKDAKSKSETIEPSVGAFIKDVRRLDDKVDSLSRSKDIVLKKLKDYEAQIVKQRQAEEELQQDRDMLQQKVNAQLLQITSLQARIEKRRFGLEDDEIADRLLELQEELSKERQLVDCKTKQIEELQECVTEMQQQCNAYKKQVSELMQRYNSDVNLHKQAQLASSVELTETKQRSEILKNDLLKTQKQLEDVSSLLQSVMTEKNKEIDMMSTETQLLERDNEELKRTVENLEAKISNALKTQQQLSLANENVTKLTQDALEKETKLNETERELKKCVEIMEQKRREVEALKVVLEEKAQLVEQVSTLRTELVDLSHYQARLQEDFDTVQSMLEDRQLELGVAQQEASELNVFKETAVEEKAQLLHEVELLKQRLEVPKIDFEVQVETNAGDKVKMEEQEMKIKSLLVELEDSLSLKEELTEKLKAEEKKVLSLNKKLKAVKNQLEDSEENVKQLNAELEKSNGDLKQTKDELNQSLQLKSRLEAEIAWRDTKIFRIEDELEQLKTNKSDVEGNAGKASLYKFLEEVRQEVLRESGNLTRSDRTADSSDGFLEPLRTDVKESSRRGDGRQSISPGISASSSDVESVSSEPLPVPVRSLMRKVYKEGIHVLNLSELNAVEEHVPTDAPVEDLNRTMKQKNWENEKGHLVAEIEALKELLTHVTNVAAASRSVDSQLSAIPELLHSILKLLSNDRTTILEQLIGSHKSTNLKSDKLEKCVSELIGMYTNLSQTIQNAVISLKRGSFIQNDPNSIAWEVQMAVAKERLLNQSEQKNLLNQLQTLEQQLGLRERQLKRQAELLEFRVQQEQLISEDLRRNLEMEKSRCIELCSQLALEKGRAAHMDMNIAQLKSDLTTAQMALEQEKQELFTTMQQLKNEKSTVESFVQALQSERANFTQLQEAMEAEKRRSKSSCQRDQQIKEELRQALITERDKQLELTTLLEAERIALQNARQELLRAQNKSSQSPFHFDKRLSVISPKGSAEDINSTLAFEKMKTVDLSAALQKEQHKVNVLAASLQQDRKQLLDELDSVKDTCTRLQSKLEITEVQKTNLLKEVQRNREEVHRLELENERICSELSISQNYVCQKDQDLEQLRRVHREINKDWDIERELARQKLQEMKLEICKLEQKVASFEKEKEMIKRGENLIDGGFVFGQQQQNRQHFMQSLRTDTGLSRIQCTSLENLRQRIFLLTLKIRDNVSRYLHSDIPAEVNFDKFSFSVKSIITELDAFGQELQMPLQNEEGLGAHLELMEKVVKHNAELAEFALRLSEDKLSLRETLMREKNELDSLKWAQGTSGVHSLPSNAGILSAERASWAQERTRLQQALHKAESDLVRVSSRQSRVTSPAAIDQVDDAKVIWQKYLRAESFRKNLVFQKTYLLLVLAGYQYTESGTLEMLGRLGCLTNPRSSGRNEYRHSKAFQRFRSAARLVGAIFRMKFLVRRWRRHDGSFLHTCGTPIYENYNDRFSMTSSISYTPSGHSQSHRFSLNSGYTPPVMDAPKRVSVDEKSSVCRNLPFATASLSSSGSSNFSVNGRLSEYVRRFDNIQQQLGIVVKDPKAVEK